MAFTSTHVAALEAAVAAGVLTVEHNGRRVTYQSMSDLLKALAQARLEVANAAASGGVAVTQSYAEFDRD